MLSQHSIITILSLSGIEQSPPKKGVLEKTVCICRLEIFRENNL